MAAASSTVASSGIAALPPTTARQIGSGQVLLDASSVVKELIDNALDARAKSIFVDIAVNTIDAIQVKDDGHGIPSEDRLLLCRSYCTSKIRDLHDLRDVGGRWLGFRGEALSSMAEMSGSLMVTTRVEGEPVAVKLKYGRDGELASTERDSHPVGTTVKVTNFLEYIPVRKQTAIKNAAKCLAKIRRIIQAYVLARPGIRFRLRILKARNNAGDLVYAPKADASVEDAVLKIFGQDCAMQCGSATVEADCFDIHALLPKPTAIGSKISNHGSFVSVDARPVSSHRGIVKQLVRACKNRLGQVNASLSSARDPFFCININCPLGSYDVNIEPAKDDVLFENSHAVLNVLDKLLKSYYPEAIANIDSDELSLSAPQNRELEPEEVLAPDENDISNRDEDIESRLQPRWRTSMYGIDEDDLEFLQDDRAPIIDEEEDHRAIEVSNPWTIARMNAVIKPRQPATNGQLPSPSKSVKDVNKHSSPSKVPAIPSRITSAEPFTPQTSSNMNTLRSPLDGELERSIQRLHQPGLRIEHVIDQSGEHRTEPLKNDRDSNSLEVELPDLVSLSSHQTSDNWASSSVRNGSMDLEMTTPIDRTTHPQQPNRDPKPSGMSARQKKTMNPETLYFQEGISSSPRKSLSVAAEQTGENRLCSKNNKDIRDWLRQRNEVRERDLAQERSFTPINRLSQTVPSGPLSLLAPVDRNRPLPRNERAALRSDPAEPRIIRDCLQAYSERVGTRPSLPTKSQMSMQFDQWPATTRQFSVYKGESAIYRASSPSTERLSLESAQSSAIPATRSKPRANLRSKSIDQMTVFFQSHLENTPTSPSQRLHRTVPPLGKSRPIVATDTSEPANPSGHPMHNLTLILRTSMTEEAIICQALTRHDHLPKWDCTAEEAYHCFDEQVPEERIAVWVYKLDNMLCALYERVGGWRETRGVLEERVRRALGKGLDEEYGSGGRKGDQENGGIDDVIADNSEDVYDDDVEEEMLMDL